jgi:hypothetical protein
MGVIKCILGGKRGNSGGKVNRALKKPPSLEIDIRIWNDTDMHEYTLESICRVSRTDLRAHLLADYHWDCSRSYLISFLIMCGYDCYQMTLGHVTGIVLLPSMTFHS